MTLKWSDEEESKTKIGPILWRSPVIWSKSWNFKVKSPVLQCLAKGVYHNLLKVDYFTIQNLELGFGLGKLSEPSYTFCNTFEKNVCTVVSKGLSNIAMHLLKNSARKGNSISVLQ